ncbi:MULTISPECIES: sulfite exporter TauE/SafE family protein [Methylomonas]|uniref:sulfite exporter TauE/SafE family protein n=1 Tax=Methylomonas TaxID=416 RepID=UPI000A81CB31|nr:MULTISPECIES: sulfite exporter TauE/SafE family protein [Methylomonas]WGS86345.1 sulfite exporter TauE/SafE family protein [Methylomonas sp. UP202]
MLELDWIAAYLGLGVAVGFFAGLLGIGGGGIMVPVLTTLFAMQNFGAAHLVHMALATSMAAIIVTSIASLRAHHRHGAVIWPVVWTLSPGIIAGTFAAAFVAALIPNRPLALFFVVFMAYVSLQMVLNVRPKPSRQLPGAMGLSLVGLLIGAVSALVAIGGGSLTVPFLSWCNVRIQNAIGTSAAVGLPLSLAGTLGYMASGWRVEGLPAHSFGYIYLPAVAAIALVSVVTAPLGARLAHRLPVPALKKLFALLLLLLSAKMLHTVYGA